MQMEEAHEVCEGGLVKGQWQADEEGIAKVNQKDIDESCHEVVGEEAGFIILGKDVDDLNSNVVAEVEDLNG